MTSAYLTPAAALRRVTAAAQRLAAANHADRLAAPEPLRRAACALRHLGLDHPVTQRRLRDATP